MYKAAALPLSYETKIAGQPWNLTTHLGAYMSAVESRTVCGTAHKILSASYRVFPAVDNCGTWPRPVLLRTWYPVSESNTPCLGVSEMHTTSLLTGYRNLVDRQGLEPRHSA